MTNQPGAVLPDHVREQHLRIERHETGLREDGGTITEYFLAEYTPRRRDDSLSLVPSKSGKDIRDQLF